MSITFFLFDYFRWHYLKGPSALFHVWHNILLYVEQVFSIRLHALTLFSPWHRVTEKRRKKWDIEDWASAVVVNVMSRFIGFFLRSFLILTGLLIMLLLCLGLLVGLLVWILAPIIVSASILGGVSLIFISYGTSI